MSKKKSKIERRRDAAQATLDRYKGVEFSFATRQDCGQMINFHLRKMGLKTFNMSKLSSYTTLVGARAAIRNAYGVDTLPDLMDLKLERIAPAAALVGDIIAMEGDGPLGTLTVALGNDMVIAFHEDHSGAVVGRIAGEPLGAWRTLPL